MRALFVFLALSFASGASTQCVISHPIMDSTAHLRWIDGAIAPDGSILGAIVPEDQFGDAMVVKIHPNGNVAWTKRIATTDPLIKLYPSRVVPSQTGGALLFGDRKQPNCTNYFAVHLDASGEPEWARIYMEPIAASVAGFRPSIAMHADGGYVIALSGWTRIHVIHIDEFGDLLWYKNYDDTLSYASDHWSGEGMTMDPNGDMVFAFGHPLTADTGAISIVHTNNMGEPQWSHTYDIQCGTVRSMVRASNGDHLIGGAVDFWSSSAGFLVRLDAMGNFLWKRTYEDVGALTNIVELASGELILGFDNSYSFTGDSVSIVHAGTDGTVIASWLDEPFYLPNYWIEFRLSPLGDVIGLRNDSIIWATTVMGPNGSYYPEIVIAGNPGALGCALTPTATTATPAPGPLSVSDTLVTMSDTARSWSMSIGEAIELTNMDLQCGMGAGAARPGFQVTYYFYLNNLMGLSTGSIDASVALDPQLNFLSADPAPTSVVGNTLAWTDLPSLQGFPYGLNVLTITALVPASVPIGTVIVHSGSASPDSVDVFLDNNTFSFTQTVTGSYDPNDKLVWPEDVYDLNTDSILDYTIRFQNTGTDTAFTVVVVDTLPAEISVGSFQPGPASHPYEYSLNAQGILTFTFENILLPDSNVNEPASHGLVGFRVRPDDGLPVGTTITNAADIYFDFNPPVRTPDATVVLTIPTDIPDLRSEQVSAYPVPVSDALTVMLPEGFVVRRLELNTLDGRRVHLPSHVEFMGRLLLPTTDLTAGVYVLSFLSIDGRKAAVRFVKE